MAKKSTTTTGPTPLSYAAATLVEPGRVPAGLGQAGEKLWARIMAQYDLRDEGGRELLFQAATAADRCERLRRIINNDGELVEGKDGAPAREHPLLRHEVAMKSFLTRTLTRLNLDMEPARPSPGRSPGRSGVI